MVNFEVSDYIHQLEQENNRLLKDNQDLKDKLHRRNLQIRDLKKKSFDWIKLSEILNYHINNQEQEDKILEDLHKEFNR